MSRITLFQGLLMNLNQSIEVNRREYLTREEAYQQLKSLSGQDFGYDVESWKKWLKENIGAQYSIKNAGISSSHHLR